VSDRRSRLSGPRKQLTALVRRGGNENVSLSTVDTAPRVNFFDQCCRSRFSLVLRNRQSSHQSLYPFRRTGSVKIPQLLTDRLACSGMAAGFYPRLLFIYEFGRIDTEGFR